MLIWCLLQKQKEVLQDYSNYKNNLSYFHQIEANNIFQTQTGSTKTSFAKQQSSITWHCLFHCHPSELLFLWSFSPEESVFRRMQDPYVEIHKMQMETLASVAISFLCPGTAEVAETFSFFLVLTSQISDKRKKEILVTPKTEPPQLITHKWRKVTAD